MRSRSHEAGIGRDRVERSVGWQPQALAAPIGPRTVAAERLAAADAEKRQDWDVALQHYEDIYDSLPTDESQRGWLRGKFAELRPRVTPNSDPAKAGVWKIQVFVFRTLDFTWQDASGATRHASQRYSDEEIQQFRSDLRAFADRVWRYTAGNLRMDGVVQVIDEPLTRLDGTDAFWPGPDACMPHLSALQPGEVDTIMVFVKTSGDQEPSDPIPLALLGGTLGVSPGTKNATYIGFNWGAGQCDNEPRGEAMLHEWLHSAQWALEDYQGYPPGLMVTSDGGRMEGEMGGDACYRRQPSESSWMNFYEHIMRDHATRRMSHELSVRQPPRNVWTNLFCRDFLVLGPLSTAGKPNCGLDEPFLDETARSVGPADGSGRMHLAAGLVRGPIPGSDQGSGRPARASGLPGTRRPLALPPASPVPHRLG